MNSTTLFPRLLIALQCNYPQTAVLCALMFRHAATTPISISWAELAAQTPHTTRSTVSRAVAELIHLGLVLEVSDDSTPWNAAKQYKVQLDALAALLDAPMPDFPVLPGVTQIPAFDALAASLVQPTNEATFDD